MSILLINGLHSNYRILNTFFFHHTGRKYNVYTILILGFLYRAQT